MSPYSSTLVAELGHDLVALKAKLPNIPRNLLVEYLIIVIDHVKDPPPGVEAMKHDSFSPQPVKYAKAYYPRTGPSRLARQTKFVRILEKHQDGYGHGLESY